MGADVACGVCLDGWPYSGAEENPLHQKPAVLFVEAVSFSTRQRERYVCHSRRADSLLTAHDDLVLAAIQEGFDQIPPVLLVVEFLVLGDGANAELPGFAKPEVMGRVKALPVLDLPLGVNSDPDGVLGVAEIGVVQGLVTL